MDSVQVLDLSCFLNVCIWKHLEAELLVGHFEQGQEEMPLFQCHLKVDESVPYNIIFDGGIGI